MAALALCSCFSSLYNWPCDSLHTRPVVDHTFNCISLLILSSLCVFLPNIFPSDSNKYSEFSQFCLNSPFFFLISGCFSHELRLNLASSGLKLRVCGGIIALQLNSQPAVTQHVKRQRFVFRGYEPRKAGSRRSRNTRTERVEEMCSEVQLLMI